MHEFLKLVILRCYLMRREKNGICHSQLRLLKLNNVCHPQVSQDGTIIRVTPTDQSVQYYEIYQDTHSVEITGIWAKWSVGTSSFSH